MTITHVSAHEPGIDSDEVELHRVCAGRQVEGLCYFLTRTPGVVTTADSAELATRGDRTTVPTLEILYIVKV